MKYFYGGAFDPITVAHINIMKAIHKQLRSEDQMFVAISNNDEKNYHSTLDERFNIVHDTLVEKFKTNTPVLMKQDKRTLAFLTENFNGQENEITICMGEDEWNALINGKWVNWDLLLKLYKFLVVRRITGENKTEPNMPKGIAATVTFIETENTLGISSSAVREILYKSPNTHYEAVSQFITHQTFRSIKENRLYKQNDFDYDKEEAEFLKEYAKKKAENNWGEPSVTTDTVAYNGDKVLLIRRKRPPYQNYWALPGGFFEKTDADLNYGAARELQEETGLELDPNKFIQIKTYGHNFDPRMKIVDTAFAVRVRSSDMKKVCGADDAAEAKWFDINDLPELAFHHKMIIEDWQKLRRLMNIED